MPAWDNFRALCAKVSGRPKNTIPGRTHIVKKTPSFIEDALVEHTLDAGCEAVDLEELNHESIGRMQACEFFGVCVAIYVELSHLGISSVG